MKTMSDTVAVVTGSGSGIGQATAVELARCGSLVHLVEINPDAAADTEDRIRSAGGNAVTVAMDVGDSAAWDDLQSRLRSEHGRLDALVNNAYTIRRARADQMSLLEWDIQLRTNLTSVFNSVHAFFPLLDESMGAIVNVASVHAYIGVPGNPAYAASKGGMIALTRQLAVEYAPSIRVNAVVPGPILTAAWKDLSGEDLRLSGRSTALGRLGEPEEVARAIRFLLSSEASFITGTTLTVDGGWLAKKGND